MTLLQDTTDKNGLKAHRAKMELETAPFSQTFGPKAQRRRVKLDVESLADLAGDIAQKGIDFADKVENSVGPEVGQGEGQADSMMQDAGHTPVLAQEAIFSKGQSKRIWNELYKVIDSSDVVVHVLDARDPLGTRCRSIEEHIRKEAPHKHLLFILNKCDLVPTSVTVCWPVYS